MDATPGTDRKVMSLRDAIRLHLRPGMKIHLAAGIGGPSAAICEIIRQYRGAEPEFTLIQSTVAGHALNLVHCRLVKKMICSACIDISETSRPSKIVQQACEAGRIDMENWSLCSLQQRLMAAAMGLPFMPTRSVLGSSIAVENKAYFKEMPDPFGSGAEVGILGALQPDVSILHGCAADEAGNVILAAPYGEDLWGALASSTGVVATVEKIVRSETIRQYAALVKIPGYLVKAVVAAPLGLHPFSLANPIENEIETYEKDNDFLNDLHAASLREDALDDWIKQWVLDCADHSQYLNKLGDVRIRALKEQSGRRRKAITPDQATAREVSQDFDAKEMMLIALSREILESVASRGHRTILAGAGAAATAAFLAYYQLATAGRDIDLITGNGQLGYLPIPGESILASEPGVRSSKILTDTIMTHGVFVGGQQNRCLSILGAGQIDRFGNINSTRTSSGKFLVGSGGANDAMNASEVILCLEQSKERFAGEIPYISGRGDSVTTVVSTSGVFKKAGPKAELILAACFPCSEYRSLDEKVLEIRKRCGWDPQVSPNVGELPKPTREELRLLRWLRSYSSA